MPQCDLRKAPWHDDLLKTVKDPAGRAVLLQLMYRFKPLQESFSGSDTHLTAYREGVRAAGRWLLEQIEIAAPEEAGPLMLDLLKHERSLYERRKRGDDEHGADERRLDGSGDGDEGGGGFGIFEVSSD